MTLQEVIEEVKLELTGQVLELEIEDATIVQVIHKALRELERYWDETTMVTVPFASCIDYSKGEFGEQVSSIVKVYRTEGVGDAAPTTMDPMFAQQ